MSLADVLALLRPKGERWYRASLDVDPDWLESVAAHARASSTIEHAALSLQQACEAAVSAELAAMGLPARVAYQDPTDERAWSATVRRASERPVLSSAHVTVRDLVPADPPAAPPAPSTDALLDLGLNADEARAVRVALFRERDPAKLDGFARSFAADHPIAHALLADKARRQRDARTFRIAGRAVQTHTHLSEPGAYLRLLPLPAEQIPDYRHALAEIVEDVPPAEIDVAPNVLEAALASFDVDGRTLDVEAVKHLSANAPGYKDPSNAALQLAFARLRPKTSGVRDPGAIRARSAEVARAARAGDPEAAKAQAQIERARRYIERQNWVMWYDRADRTRML